MNKKPKISILILLLILGALFFMNTSPSEVPIYVLTLPFIYFFILVYVTVSVVQDLFSRDIAAPIPLIVSALTLLMLILGSLHQLGAKDITLSLVLMVLLGWYIHKLSPK